MHCNPSPPAPACGGGVGKLIGNVRTQPTGHGRVKLGMGMGESMKLPGLTRCLVSVESVVLGSERP